MNQASTPLSPEARLARAELWFTRQVAVLAACYGESWPEHRSTIEGCLKDELRQRLIAEGWRPTR